MNCHRLLPLIEVVMIVTILLGIYSGTYLAIVMPQGCFAGTDEPFPTMEQCWVHYRICPKYAKILFWPLEQIDRQVRWWN